MVRTLRRPAGDDPKKRQAAFFDAVSPIEGCHLAFNRMPGVRVVIKDRDGRFMWVSDNVPGRHGFESAAAMLGLHDRDINPPSLAEAYWSDDRMVMDSGRALLAKTEVSFNEAGLPDWFVVDKLPLRDRQGRVCGLIATIVPHDGLSRPPIQCREVHLATAYVDARLGAKLRACDVAGAAGVSVRQLQRLFVSSVGLTLSEFIARRRIMEACRLLRETTLPLGQIAVAVGFYDQSAFNRVFRRYVPVRPLDYRRAQSQIATTRGTPSTP